MKARLFGRVALVATITVAAGQAGTTAAGASGASAKAPRPAAAPAYAWPKIAHDPSDTGVSADPFLSASSAGSLGVRWMAGTGASILASPVVAYNAAAARTLVYQGNEGGYMTAFDGSTGAAVWSDNLGSAIRDTALVDSSGNVWISPTFAPRLYKLNGATGAVECSTPLVSTDNGSATIGTGPDGNPAVFIGVNDLGTQSGPVYAVSAATCTSEFQFTDFNSVAGSWDPLSYATDATGRGLVLLGTADPDESIYAIDTKTAAKVWSFKTTQVPGRSDTDVGAGVSVTAPGVNGFSDGMAYVPGKDGYLFALDLTTGALVWSYNFGVNDGAPESKSTPAVLGNEVIFGVTNGVIALNATTGSRLWAWNDGGGEVLSAPAVVGPAGGQVVAVASLSGSIDVLSASTGSLLYRYQTGSYSTSSVADVDGNLLASSADGFLYDLDVNGGNGAAPTTTVDSPANGSTVANPNGSLVIGGHATGQSISAVNVAIQQGGAAGPWWNGSTGTWTPGFYDNPAQVTGAGTQTATWSISVPVPAAGGVYRVLASAVQANGLADISADGTATSSATSSFAVAYSKASPHIWSPQGMWFAPGQSITVNGTGFGPSEAVQISLNGVVLATPNSSSSGALSNVPVRIPTSAAYGPAALVATGQTSSRSGSAPIHVSNSWLEDGYSSLHGNFEPNDSTMAQHVSPSQGQYFTEAWSYPTGAPVTASMIISKDVAYFGNQAGTFTALDVRNSQPVWTFNAPSGSSIPTTAALGGGRVYFGTSTGSAGTVVAVGATTGAPAWTTSTASPVTSGVAASGSSVLVGTSNGSLVDLNSQTGATVWTHTVSGHVTGTPAVDPTAGLVVVGDTSGAITALNISNGSLAWSYQTGGSVTGSCLLFGGSVMVGSADKKVYSLNEKTGSLSWSATTAGAVVGGGALYQSMHDTAPAQVAFGSSDGNLYYLSLSTGRIAKTVAIGGPVVAVSSAIGWVDAVTSDGIAAGDKPGNVAWKVQATAPFAAAPTPLNGVVYTAGEDQTVRAYSLPGVAIP